jgi:flavin reductase (DIM6/NTAB) family NADH-FMN oxidoreductase RutF
MEISPSSLPWKSVHKLFTGSILPRPIGWISTVNTRGQPNLAPFSFFNIVCAKPPTLLFCPTVRSTDGKHKDTLNNIRETGEFVVNIVTEELAGAMNESAAEVSPAVNEFELADVESSPSAAVKAPRVTDSPIHFECKLREIIQISDQPGGGYVVLGTVVHLHIDDRVLQGKDKIDLAGLKPIGRLAGGDYVRMTDLFNLKRPKSQLAEE